MPLEPLAHGDSPYIPKSYARHIRGIDRRTKALEAYPQPVRLQIKIFADAQDVEVGDSALIFFVTDDLDGLSLIDADIGVTTESSSGVVTVQLRNIDNGNVDMLSTAMTIDVGEITSYTAVAPPVVNEATDDVGTGDRISIDVDVAGTGAKGLTLFVTFGIPLSLV